MEWLQNLINKLFLVKEIRSQEGELHFLRWRFFSCPWFRIYLHKICLPDYDEHQHTHPWNFISLILKGGYYEEWRNEPEWHITKSAYWTRGSLIHHKRSDSHSIKRMIGPVWTLVFSYGSYKPWGYRVWSEETNSNSKWIEANAYRKMKNAIFGIKGQKLEVGLMDLPKNPTIRSVKIDLKKLMKRD